MTTVLAQHQPSGETYVIAYNGDGRITGVAGPYDHRHVREIRVGQDEDIALYADRNDNDIEWADDQQWQI